MPKFDDDTPQIERDLVTDFYNDREVRVAPIRETADEPFSASMDRTAKRVLEIMNKYKLYDLADSSEQVISNVKYFVDSDWDGWMYSVRMQKRAD